MGKLIILSSSALRYMCHGMKNASLRILVFFFLNYIQLEIIEKLYLVCFHSHIHIQKRLICPCVRVSFWETLPKQINGVFERGVSRKLEARLIGPKVPKVLQLLRPALAPKLDCRPSLTNPTWERVEPIE